MRIHEVVGAKAAHQEVVSISPDATVRDLIDLLAQHNIGAAVVTNADDQLVGIVSERDVVRRLAEIQQILSAPVSDIMTTTVHTCTSTDALDDIRGLMTKERVRHVPVIDDSRIVGVISIGDVVKSHINQVEFERDQLDSYVHQT
jgi:CBS domain-containing protein